MLKCAQRISGHIALPHSTVKRSCAGALSGTGCPALTPASPPLLPHCPPCCSCVAKFSMFWQLPDGAMGILNGMEEDSRPKLALDTPADVDAFFASKRAAKLAYQAAKGLQVGVRWSAIQLTLVVSLSTPCGLRLNWRTRGCRRAHARQQPPSKPPAAVLLAAAHPGIAWPIRACIFLRLTCPVDMRGALLLLSVSFCRWARSTSSLSSLDALHTRRAAVSADPVILACNYEPVSYNQGAC